MTFPAFLAPRGTLAQKPPHGAPCNRCGLCCVATICDLGQHVFGRGPEGPCPGLQKDELDGKPTCGLVVEPMRYDMRRSLLNGWQRMREAALLLIGASEGCDARFNGEAINHAFNGEWIRRTRHSDVRKARKLWGM